MRRSFWDLMSIRALRSLLYGPRAVLLFRSWFALLLNYAGIRDTGNCYTLRSGTVIQTTSGLDAVTVTVVWLRRDYGHVPKGSRVIVDIGANIGVYSLYAASGAPRAVVYAYEPMPENYRSLCRNLEANRLGARVVPHQLGIAGTAGRQKLFMGEGSPYHSVYSTPDRREFVEMETTTLEAIFKEHRIRSCDLLKIDCEGAEFEALYATPPSCLARIAEIRMEYHDRRERADYNILALERFLGTHGFVRTRIDEDALIAWFVRA